MKQEPTLYGQQTTAHVEVPPPEPTALEWFKEFNLLMVAVLVPIVLAWIGYLTVKAKVNARNALRRKEWEESDKDDYEPGDETVMDYMRSQMKDKK